MVKNIAILLSAACITLGVWGYFLAGGGNGQNETGETVAQRNLVGALLSGGGAVAHPDYTGPKP